MADSPSNPEDPGAAMSAASFQAWLAGLPTNDPGPERDPLEALAEEFVERFRRGERPPLSEYTSKAPELASAIRELFPALVILEEVRPPAGSSGEGHAAHAGGRRPERLGDYRVLREVGRGGMGVVYEAVQESLGRRVALKVLPGQALLDPRQVERFRREARAAARLHHTNIVPVFGVGEHDGLPNYVMQFIQGLGLDQVLAELPRLLRGPGADTPGQPPAGGAEAGPALSVARSLLTGAFAPPASAADQERGQEEDRQTKDGRSPVTLSSSQGQPYWRSVARLGIQVAEALAYAHGQGVLHRDVKPSNLLLDTQGVVWVTDFGLAKASDSETLTRSSDVVGTLRYMAPERFAGRADARSDVYALGLTLYELLTLRPAFDRWGHEQLVPQVLDAEPPRPRRLNPAVPRDLETVVLKATARDPSRRYQSAAELAEDLRRFAGGRPVLARRVSAAERLWRWCRRNPWPAGLLVAIVLGSALGFWHLSRLSAALVRFSALRGAAQQSEMFDAVNDLYSAEVVDRAKRANVEATDRYLAHPTAIPTPATFTIELGRRISAQSQHGVQVRLYSDFPFPSREGGGPRDDFEREALRQLRERPEEPYFRFEEFLGRPALRYATARRMKESCVNCHNTHPESPCREWKVGDVRGVLEIIRPLDKDVERTGEGLRGSFVLVAGSSAALLGLFGLALVLGRRRASAGQGVALY
jgi:serine/threonine protein kinase